MRTVALALLCLVACTYGQDPPTGNPSLPGGSCQDCSVCLCDPGGNPPTGTVDPNPGGDPGGDVNPPPEPTAKPTSVCQNTAAIDTACPHAAAGSIVPDKCDDPTTFIDDGCADEFTEWWKQCSTYLSSNLPAASTAKLNAFNTKCRAVIAASGIKITSGNSSCASRIIDDAIVYDEGYPDNTKCDWTVTCPAGKSVKLHYRMLSTEDCCDYIDVYSGSSENGKMLASDAGQATPADIRTCSDNNMYLSFFTDDNAGHDPTSESNKDAKGFAADFDCVTTETAAKCASTCSPRTCPIGTIVSLSDAGKKDMDAQQGPLKDGVTGQVFLVDGPRDINVITADGSTWDYKASDIIPSPGTAVTVATTNSSCAGAIKGATIDMEGTAYFNNEHCAWSVTCPTGSQVNTRFSLLQLESQADFVKIYDGTTESPTALLRSSTGMLNENFYQNCKSPKQLLTFTSDAQNSAAGFVADFTCQKVVACGGAGSPCSMCCCPIGTKVKLVASTAAQTITDNADGPLKTAASTVQISAFGGQWPISVDVLDGSGGSYGYNLNLLTKAS